MSTIGDLIIGMAEKLIVGIKSLLVKIPFELDLTLLVISLLLGWMLYSQINKNKMTSTISISIISALIFLILRMGG